MYLEMKTFQGVLMLRWALIFLLISMFAGALGFGGVAGAAAGMAKFLFGLFLVCAVIFFIIGLTIAKKVTS